jgi:hypothetical protein
MPADAAAGQRIGGGVSDRESPPPALTSVVARAALRRAWRLRAAAAALAVKTQILPVRHLQERMFCGRRPTSDRACNRGR